MFWTVDVSKKLAVEYLFFMTESIIILVPKPHNTESVASIRSHRKYTTSNHGHRHLSRVVSYARSTVMGVGLGWILLQFSWATAIKHNTLFVCFSCTWNQPKMIDFIANRHSVLLGREISDLLHGRFITQYSSSIIHVNIAVPPYQATNEEERQHVWAGRAECAFQPAVGQSIHETCCILQRVWP